MRRRLMRPPRTPAVLAARAGTVESRSEKSSVVTWRDCTTATDPSLRATAWTRCATVPMVHPSTHVRSRANRRSAPARAARLAARCSRKSDKP